MGNQLVKRSAAGATSSGPSLNSGSQIAPSAEHGLRAEFLRESPCKPESGRADSCLHPPPGSARRDALGNGRWTHSDRVLGAMIANKPQRYVPVPWTCFNHSAAGGPHVLESAGHTPPPAPPRPTDTA